MASRVSSPGLSPLRARGPTCAWSSRASGRVRGRPTRAPRSAGRNSSKASNAWWEACREPRPRLALPARARRAALVARADDHWPSLPRLLRACGYAEHRSEETRYPGVAHGGRHVRARIDDPASHHTQVERPSGNGDDRFAPARPAGLDCAPELLCDRVLDDRQRMVHRGWLISGAFQPNGEPLPGSFAVLPTFQAHAVLATLLATLIAAHIAAALYHQFVLKDGLLRRMWFGRRTIVPAEK